jgi:hypothetical protein
MKAAIKTLISLIFIIFASIASFPQQVLPSQIDPHRLPQVTLTQIDPHPLEKPKQVSTRSTGDAKAMFREIMSIITSFGYAFEKVIDKTGEITAVRFNED